MRFKFLSLLVLTIFTLTLALPEVYAQFPIGGAGGQTNLRPWVDFIVGNNTWPDSWMAFPNIVYYLILPYLAIVAVIYGIMSDIRIFKSQNVRIFLSVSMAAMTLPSGVLISWVLTLYSFNAFFAAIAFGVVFFIGIIFWAIGRFFFLGFGIKGEYQAAKAAAKTLGSVNAEINRLATRKAELITKGNLSAGEEREIKKIDQKIIELHAQERQINEET